MAISDEQRQPVSANENPYAPPSPSESENGNSVTRGGLDVIAFLAVVACSAWLTILFFATVVSLPYGDPSAPPLLHILGFMGMFIVLPAVSLAGSVSALKRRRYKLALAAMICLLIPVLGPCFGLTIPLGILGIVFLWPTQMRESFES